MSMSVQIPDHLMPFVQAELQTGEFPDESSLVAKALELYREMRDKHATLREDVNEGIVQLDRGEGQPLDMSTIVEEVVRRHKESNA